MINRVCSSKWVLGAKKFITLNQNKKLILITGTPHKEIILILKRLKIFQYFYKIYGSPLKKSQIVKKIFGSHVYSKINYIYFGNSYSDFLAAKKNKILYVNIGKIRGFKKKYIKIKNFKSLNNHIL